MDFKEITDKINLKEIADKIDLKNDKKSEPSYKTDYEYYIKNPSILADKIVEIYNNNPNAKVYNPKNKKKFDCNMLLIKLTEMKTLMNNIKNL